MTHVGVNASLASTCMTWGYTYSYLVASSPLACIAVALSTPVITAPALAMVFSFAAVVVTICAGTCSDFELAPPHCLDGEVSRRPGALAATYASHVYHHGLCRCADTIADAEIDYSVGGG